MNPFAFCTLFSAGAAAFFDIRERRIPNPLVGVTLGAALVLQLTEHAFYGVLYFAGGALVPLAILYPAYRLGCVGAGDVKLLAALGSFFSPAGSLRFLFVSFLCGALFAAVRMTVSGLWAERFASLRTYVSETVRCGHFLSYRPFSERRAQLRFSLPVLTAVVLLIIGGKI